MQSYLFTVASLLAAGAAAWTVDLRNNYEDNHTMYIKAGETLEVLVDGMSGTGYKWISNVDYQQQLNDKAPGHIQFVEETKMQDAPRGFFGNDDESEVMMGGKKSYQLNFSTEEGSEYDEELKFVYARSWMLKEFPEERANAGNDWSQIRVVAKKEFAYDLQSDNFNLENLPSDMNVAPGDLIRLVIRENPTTGFWWHSNALKAQNSGIREIFNGFQAPDLRLMGASGKRVLVFEVNDPTAELKLGLCRPGDEADLFGYEAGKDELDDHLFRKSIKFSASAITEDPTIYQ